MAENTSNTTKVAMQQPQLGTLNIFYKRRCELLPRPVSYIFQHFPQPCPLFISYFSSKFGQAPHAKMESIAFKPFKCPLNGPHMGGKVSWYTNWGCLAYFTKCPTIQIASSANSASTASGPQCALSLNFFEKARPCLLFFLQFADRLLQAVSYKR